MPTDAPKPVPGDGPCLWAAHVPNDPAGRSVTFHARTANPGEAADLARVYLGLPDPGPTVEVRRLR